MRFELEWVDRFPQWVMLSLNIGKRFKASVDANVIPELGAYVCMIGDIITVRIGVLFIAFFVALDVGKRERE